MSKNRIIPTVWVTGAMLLSLPAIASAASVMAQSDVPKHGLRAMYEPITITDPLARGSNPSDTQAHTDQPREISQDMQSPFGDKPTDDEKPDGDAKASDERGVPPIYSDLFIDDSSVLPTGLDRDVPVDGTLQPWSFDEPASGSIDGHTYAGPLNVPAPSGVIVLGLAAGLGARRRR